MFRIVYVCTGNICRTPMAVALTNKKVKEENLENIIEVDSVGVWAADGAPASENTRRVCQEHGLDCSQHRAKSVDLFTLKNADLVLCMAEKHKRDLLAIFPHYKDKIFTLKEFANPEPPSHRSIDDPYGLKLEAYRHTFQEISQEVERFWETVKQMALQKVKNSA